MNSATSFGPTVKCNECGREWSGNGSGIGMWNDWGCTNAFKNSTGGCAASKTYYFGQIIPPYNPCIPEEPNLVCSGAVVLADSNPILLTVDNWTWR